MRGTVLLLVLASLAAAGETLEEAVQRRIQAGLDRYKEKDWDGAIHEFTKAIELDGGHAPAWWQRGRARQARKDYDGALEDYGKAADLDPGFMEARYSRGVLRQFKGDPEGAVEDFTAVIDLPREKLTTWYVTNAHVGRGNSRRELVDYAGAVEDYGYALYYDPKNPAHYEARAKVHEAMANWEGAVADYTAILEEIDHNYAPAYAARGRARSHLGDQADADKDFEAAIFLKADDAEIHLMRARCRMMRGDYKGAVADCDRAVELNEKWYYPYYTRALVHYNFGDYRKARLDLHKGAKRSTTEPDYLKLYDLLVSHRLKRGERGVAELKEYVAAKKEPVDPWYGNVVAFLCGEMEEEAFLAAAEAPTPKATRERRCEACFYAGTMRLLAGDRERALALFRECVDTGIDYYIEYETSTIELTKLR